MRRDFDLPEDDREFLDARGCPWETIIGSSGQRWLLLENYEVPPGYNNQQVLAALQIASDYPDMQIDMVYVFPSLSLAGKSIGGLTTQEIDGKTFQRWSRHRTADNPWRIGVDCIATHLLQADEWLRREIASS